MMTDEAMYVEDTPIQRAEPGDVSVGVLISDAWQLVRANPLETVGGFVAVMGIIYGMQFVFTIGIYAAVAVLMFGFIALGEVIGQDAAGVLAIIGGGFGYMTMVATMVVLQTLALAVYQMFWLKIVRGQTESIRFGQVLRYAAAPLALSALLTTIATMVGMLGLIIGAYIVMLGLMFTQTIVWDHRLGAVDAMKRSWTLMDGNKLQLFVLMLAVTLLNIAGAMMCGVGMFVTAPLSVGVIVSFYDRIATPGNAYLRV